MSYQATLVMVNKLAINWSKEFLDWQRKVEIDAETEKKDFKADKRDG